ncbi:uncharacterized protein [Rutidosis leptorrhynchoides]|uniref:uncharacterized protein isoform X2 n=1 Tax=Rutidosis leptorrhynchoides TaxID=125765 RepID=UPI003A998380
MSNNLHLQIAEIIIYNCYSKILTSSTDSVVIMLLIIILDMEDHVSIHKVVEYLEYEDVNPMSVPPQAHRLESLMQRSPTAHVIVACFF